MSFEINIPDGDLSGFSSEAKEHLKQKTRKFANDLIEEANRIEAGRNSTGGTPEVTGPMVNDADIFLRRGFSGSRKSLGNRILRITSAVLTLCVGLLYNATKLQEGWYMMLFIFTIAGAILTVTISVLKE